MINYIADRNRFKLEKPPDWWLQALYDFDNMLVLIPSRMEPIYRLARRKQFSPGIGPAAVHDPQADTAMMVAYDLVPVTSLVTYGVWTLNFLNELQRRDIWAAGGADKFVDEIETVEEQKKQRIRNTFREEIGYRARDAWRSLQARAGWRSRISDQPKASGIVAASKQDLPVDVRGVPSGSTASVR